MSDGVTAAASGRDGLTTGRPLDEQGDPTDGPALELDPDGRVADLLASSSGPLVSSPGAGTWATLLERPAEGDGDRPVLLQWLAPDAASPPPHAHPDTETFHVLEGTLSVTVDGDERRFAPGESVAVPPDTAHTFRNDTGDRVVFRAELPSMRTAESLHTIWGLDHEGAFGPDGEYGEPGPLSALVIAADTYPDTVVTSVPVPVQRLLWATLGTLLNALGYPGVDDRYLDEAFWAARVEQPDLSP